MRAKVPAAYYRRYRAMRKARGGGLLSHEERSVIAHRTQPQHETGYRAERRRRSMARQTRTLRKEL